MLSAGMSVQRLILVVEWSVVARGAVDPRRRSGRRSGVPSRAWSTACGPSPSDPGSSSPCRSLEGGGLVGEVAAGPDGRADEGVDTLDRVRRADRLADLDVEGEEGREFGPPGVRPQVHDRRVVRPPFSCSSSVLARSINIAINCLASLISRNSVCQLVPEAVGDQWRCGWRCQMTAPPCPKTW